MKFENPKKLKIFSLLILICAPFLFLASSGGVIGKTKKNGSGCTCHNMASSAGVSILFNGPSELKISEVGTFSVSISGGPLAAAGVNIATSDGSLQTISGEGLQLINSELTHTTPKTTATNSVTFQFKLTAPNQTGTITLYASGNSVNFTGTDAGDQWNHSANKTITIKPLTSIKDDLVVNKFSLEQNYPNPFNNSTIVKFSIAQDNLTSLKIYDVLGNENFTLINSILNKGEHRIKLSGANLQSGVYYLKLTSGSFTETRKMLLLK